LTAAVACFGRAQNRQVDNRHQVILQAFAFLDHYRQLCKDLNHSKSEVAFNFGRAFHRLGLYQLALPHYREALEMKDEKVKAKAKVTAATMMHKQSGFVAWSEAAYNLSLIYIASGNPSLANHIVEKYLRV
jgi:general transcription factor 3C polypeptide 3 (transcription factor C subunit 4)